jgi:hypothetical protein
MSSCADARVVRALKCPVTGIAPAVRWSLDVLSGGDPT